MIKSVKFKTKLCVSHLVSCADNILTSFQSIYLSKVPVTIFHVDEIRNPHSKSLEFHNPHSIEANNPVVLTAYESFRVKLVNSNTMDTAKSKKL